MTLTVQFIFVVFVIYHPADATSRTDSIAVIKVWFSKTFVYRCEAFHITWNSINAPKLEVDIHLTTNIDTNTTTIPR